MKTTPKPRATKNNSGELVGLLPDPLPSPSPVGEAVGALVALAVDDMFVGRMRVTVGDNESEE